MNRTDWTVRQVGFEAAIHGATSWGERAAFATDLGLLVREKDGAYLHYTLDDEAPEPVSALDGADETRLVFATDKGVAALSDSVGVLSLGALFEVAEPSKHTALTVGPYGHVWTADGSVLVKWQVGQLTTFAEVLPYLQSSCDWCHGTGLEGAPKRDFTDYDVVVSMIGPIMERVILGLMPPPKYGDTISGDELDLLIRWIDGGYSQ